MRKFRGDSLFDGYRFHADMVLVVDADGRVEGLVPLADAGDDVLYQEGIISPGFINCHCHLELSHMKGLIPEGTGLVPFVSQVMAGRFRPDEEIHEAIAAAERAMYDNGIQAVGDICNTAYTIPAKQRSRIRWYNFIEVSGFDPAMADIRYRAAEELWEKFGTAAESGQAVLRSIVPHSPYSVSVELWKKIVEGAAGKRLSIHNQEDPAENLFFHGKQGAFMELYDRMKLDLSFFNAPGTSSIRAYLGRFPAGQPLLLVHNVFTSAEDLEWIGGLQDSPDLYWCLCPQANRYISTALPDIPMLMGEGRRITLGTDSLASNHRLDLLYEIALIREFYPAIEKADLLTWATSNGALALGMEASLGSFEPGKQPGVLLLANDLSKASRLL